MNHTLLGYSMLFIYIIDFKCSIEFEIATSPIQNKMFIYLAIQVYNTHKFNEYSWDCHESNLIIEFMCNISDFEKFMNIHWILEKIDLKAYILYLLFKKPM